LKGSLKADSRLVFEVGTLAAAVIVSHRSQRLLIVNRFSQPLSIVQISEDIVVQEAQICEWAENIEYFICPMIVVLSFHCESRYTSFRRKRSWL
jgi:hypothetical protein